MLFVSSLFRDSLILSLSYTLLFRHDEIAFISCAHLFHVDGGLKIFIPSSKTNVYKNGNTALLAKSQVLALLERYLALARLSVGDHHFLFGPIIRQGGRDCIDNCKLSHTEKFYGPTISTPISMGFIVVAKAEPRLSLRVQPITSC